MSLAPPPIQAWRDLPSVWRRWFVDLYVRVGGANLEVLAPIKDPVFTGNPRAPTPAVDDNDTSIATTAYVLAQTSSANPGMDGVASAGASTRYSRADHVHPTDTSRAPLESPTFTGTPAAPTPAAGNNTTQIATTQFVATAMTPTAWTAPALINSWVNYGGVYSTAGFYRDASGVVHLQGAIRSGTIGATAFTLPAGFRPAAAQAYAIPTGAAFATYGVVHVLSDGAVVVTVGSNTLVHLAGVTFRAEQ